MKLAGCRACVSEARGRHSGGFTLIEMMVTVLVLAILVGVAVPSFRNASLSSRLTGYANDLLASTQVARSEAIKRNAPVFVCASSDGTSCLDEGDWDVGWIVVTDGGLVLQRQPALSAEFNVTEEDGLTTLEFPPTVVGVEPASFTICRGEPVGHEERVVTVTASGAASVSRTNTGNCPGAD